MAFTCTRGVHVLHQPLASNLISSSTTTSFLHKTKVATFATTSASIIMPSPPTSQPTATTTFAIHSTFRDINNDKVKPDGLEWDIPGLSEVCYVPYPPPSNNNGSIHNTSSNIDLTSPRTKRGIVEAHNRWSFAKDLPFVHVEDIDSLQSKNCHITARWKPNRHRPERIIKHGGTISEILQNDDAASESENNKEGNGDEAAEVYINGEYISTLSGPSTLPPILDVINNTLHSKKVCYRRSSGLIRIERYFRGMIRGVEVFDHLLDNLYGMEDVEVLDERTIIGTVTLPDWIMGGMLTSRLWVREQSSGNILTMRPLRNDDIDTSDRRYELIKGKDDDRMELVRAELCRLRYLARLEHPVDMRVSQEGGDSRTAAKPFESSVMRQHRINRRRQKMRL